MQQEIAKLQLEIKRLQSATTEIGDDGVSLGPVQAGSVRYSEVRRQLDRMKEELIQSDASREDMKLKVQQQEKEIQTMQQRIDELTVNQIYCDFCNFYFYCEYLLENYFRVNSIKR